MVNVYQRSGTRVEQGWYTIFFYRRGRKTYNNIFMLERMIEMAKVRKECLFVTFIDIEKAYDTVNRKKLV